MKKTELAVTTQSEGGNQLQKIDLNAIGNFNLNDAQVAPIDLMSDYWTPETPGEKKRVFFSKIDTRPVLAQDTGEIIELECAFFIGQNEKGELQSISNGSKRLVGSMLANNIEQGTMLEITYLGKKRNRSNSFQSDNWSVKPLVMNLETVK